MRTLITSLLVILLLVGGVIVTTRAIRHRATPKSPARGVASHRPFSPTATIEEIMSGLIDPASKSVFGSVGTVTERGVERQRAPKNDAEWAVVRRNAALMVEGGNLLLMPGRRITRNMTAPAAADGELAPAQIEVRVSKDRDNWDKLAQEFSATAQRAVQAAEAKDAAAVFASGGDLDTACENCHQRYWYPQDQSEDKPTGAPRKP